MGRVASSTGWAAPVASVPGIAAPEHLSSDMLHYADDPRGHTGLTYHHVQVSKSQSCLAAQYRSMVRLEYRSTSDERCRSMEEECLQLTVVRECWSMKLVFGSTVVDENRATNCCCCRSMRRVFLCGLNVPNMQGLMRITVEFPCCFWYCWACTWKDKNFFFVSESGFKK